MLIFTFYLGFDEKMMRTDKILQLLRQINFENLPAINYTLP